MNSSKRLVELRQHMNENNIDLSIILNSDNQYYISGFKAILYSRPIVLIVGADHTGLIVPGLEEEHSKAEADVDEVYVYYEHPEQADKGISYADHLRKVIQKYSAGRKIGVEYSAMPIGFANDIRNYGFELVDIGEKITEMRYIKDEQEAELIIEAGRLVSLALKESLRNARVGISEMELDQLGNKMLLEEISTKYPDATMSYFVMSPSGLTRSIMPHVFSGTRRLELNDIVVHSRQVALNGYRAECERTFFLGKPSEQQKEALNVAIEAQRAAIEIIRPGITAKEVDEAARRIIQEAGYGKYAIHRTGHGLGISEHEEPYLRFDSNLELKEGMVFSIEPGIYIPGVGGYRHSDTVILTKGGSKLVTEYPREIESLIF